jgi:hypothetical protein
MSKCDCKICKRGREFYRIVKALKKYPLIVEYLKTMYDYLLNIEEDMDYYRAILDGSWPTSVGILQTALKKAKGVKND